MADQQLRDLERIATSGSLEDMRHVVCYKIGRLDVEVSIEPTLLKKLGRGRYDGQTLWHDKGKDGTGITHPCVKWQTAREEQFWDLVSEECVWKSPTVAVTLSVFGGYSLLGSMLGGSHYGRTAVVGTPGPGEPGIMDALHGLAAGQNPAGEAPLYQIPFVESPFIPEDQILLIQPQPLQPFLREYPAQFEDHQVDAIRYALESHQEQEGDEDETEG